MMGAIPYANTLVSSTLVVADQTSRILCLLEPPYLKQRRENKVNETSSCYFQRCSSAKERILGKVFQILEMQDLMEKILFERQLAYSDKKSEER